MQATFTLDDDLFELYHAEAKERRISVGVLLNDRLKRAVALDPRDRTVILSGGRTMQILEEKLGGGDLKSAEDLLNKVTNLAVIRFGMHEFVISPGQYRELVFRAQKTGRTVPELIDAIYQKMQATFWEYVP